jgi:hypothetical protein
LPSASFANIAAALAVVLSGAALVVALGAGDGEDATTPGAPAVVEQAREADHAATAERAERAETAERARSAREAATARRATSADRLRGIEGRRLADASRRAGGVRRPKLLRLDAGKSGTALTAGPFRVRVTCADAAKGVEVRVTFSSTQEGSLVSVSGTPGAPIDEEGGRTLLKLSGDQALWSGGRSFSLASPEGPVVEGTLSYGINQLGADCVASVAGLS